MLIRQDNPHARGDDRERITRAREAAEALFTTKPPVSVPSVPDAAADRSARKPRVHFDQIRMTIAEIAAIYGVEVAATEQVRHRKA